MNPHQLVSFHRFLTCPWVSSANSVRCVQADAPSNLVASLQLAGDTGAPLGTTGTCAIATLPLKYPAKLPMMSYPASLLDAPAAFACARAARHAGRGPRSPLFLLVQCYMASLRHDPMLLMCLGDHAAVSMSSDPTPGKPRRCTTSHAVSSGGKSACSAAGWCH